MSEQDGLIAGYILDGNGGGRAVDWPEIRAWTPDQGVLWIHLDREGAEAARWLQEESGFGPIRVEALLALETRPRSVAHKDGLLVTLRGVNLNPGADPDDMVGIRLWVDASRVISVRRRRLMAIQDIRDQIEDGRGPGGAGDFLALLAARLADRMAPVIDDMDDVVDGLEDELLIAEKREIRHKLRILRRQVIGLRRYLSPQRDALSRLITEDQPWMDAVHKARLREVADRTIRYVEDLDEVRDRAAVVQDELMNQLAERMNKTMYLLTVVASVLLPLGFVTGLLGINVGGIPGAENKMGFAIVCGMLAGLLAFEVWLFRWLKWI